MGSSISTKSIFNDNPKRLNIQAVHYLSLGMHNEASFTLHYAFKCLKEQLDFQDSTATSSDWMSKDNFPNFNNNVHSISVLAGHQQDSCPKMAGINREFSCFNRAFTMHVYDSDLDQPFSLRDRNRLIAILYYNMGLLQHINGSFSGDLYKMRLALRFYRMSCIIIESVWDMIGIEDVKLLLYALWNNMAHIHSGFANIGEVKKCTYWKACILQSMVGSDSVEDTHLLEAVCVPLVSEQQFLPIAPMA